MKKTWTRRSRVTERISLTFTGEQLIELVRQTGQKVPDNAEVKFDVPTGGDWSGMDVDVDKDNPVRISFEEHLEREEEVEHCSPAERRANDFFRIRKGDNDDAKLDEICMILGLDQE